MDLCIYLPDEQAAWYEQHREELGRGWASRVLRAAIEDERRRRAGRTPEQYAAEQAAAGDAALAALRNEPEPTVVEIAAGSHLPPHVEVGAMQTGG